MKKTSLLASFALVFAFAGLAWTLTANPASNVSADSANTAENVVLRDASGNFAAGTITASLTGAASLNVLKAGDTMTGALGLYSRTKAQIDGITPSAVGQLLFCSNCTVPNVCVSTAATKASFLRVDDGTKGCGSGE